MMNNLRVGSLNKIINNYSFEQNFMYFDVSQRATTSSIIILFFYANIIKQ